MASEDVKEYLIALCEAIKGSDVSQITSHYEDWNKLTEKHFKQVEWPSPTTVSTWVNDDTNFMFLYRELWYRHYYSKLGKDVSTETRINSWKNYSALFDYLINVKKPVALHLPAQWLWDILDEFIYQFQEFRSRNQKTGEEVSSASEGSVVWDTVAVFKYLHKLIERSNIKKTLADEKNGIVSDSEFSKSQLYSYLGYWAIIALCRLNVILGDYYLAVKTLDPIDISKKSRFAQVTAAHISLFYYMGFSYLMMHRYVDAINTFVDILLFISRIKQFLSRPYGHSYDVKKTEQMYTLLAILLTISPKRIDEHVLNTLKQDYSEQLSALSGSDSVTAISSFFTYASPKFVLANSTPAPEEEIPATALDLQRNLFMKEQQDQALLPVISSYLKLYSSVNLEKLVHLLDNKIDKETLRTHLHALSLKSHQLKWSEELPPIQGNWKATSELIFSIEGDMIHVANNTEAKKYARTFVRHSNRLEEMIRDLSHA